MKYYCFLFVISYLFFLSKPVSAQKDLPDYDSVPMLLTNMAVQIECTEGVNNLYNFKFDLAESQFNFLKRRYPKHPLPYFLIALNEWWKITPNIDVEKYDQKFLSYLDSSIVMAEDLFDQNKKNKEKHIEAAFFLAAAHGFKGRLFAERKSWTKATFEGKRALKFMEVASDQNDLSPEFLFGDGLYNYFAVWVPENYPILKPVLWFFKKGDKKKGIEQLEKVVKEGFYTRTEAQYFLMRIYGNDEKEDEKAFQIAQYLYETYPDNGYFHRYYARMLFARGQLFELEKVGQKILDKIDQKYAGYEEISGRYAAYYLAYIHRIRYQDFAKSKIYYQKAVEFSEKTKDFEAGYYLYSLLELAKMDEKEEKLDEAILKCEKIIDKAERKNPAYQEAKSMKENLKDKKKKNKKKKK